jgi:hypothetical protein
MTIKVFHDEEVFQTIFFLKKSKSGTASLSTIYLRITVDGARTEISTQRHCDPIICSSCRNFCYPHYFMDTKKTTTLKYATV